MSKRIVYVCEKPTITASLLKLTEQVHPHDDVYFIHQFRFGLYNFKFPRGLKHSDFPYIADVKMKQNEYQVPIVDSKSFLIYSQTEKAYLKRNPFQHVDEVLKTADEIIFACDGDYSSVVGFHHLLKETLGEEQARMAYKAIIFKVMTMDGMQHAFDHPYSTHDAWFVNGREFGLAKQYFDYNFNLNSYVVLGDALGLAGISRYHFHLSKYSLQTLFYVDRQVDGLLSEDKLLTEMGAWTGTGKYKPNRHNAMGSVISRSAILINLQEIGLLERVGENIQLSRMGKRLLSVLHPDCCDLDLPFRIYEWCQDFEKSKACMDRYLRTFFGKQKRYFIKQQSLATAK